MPTTKRGDKDAGMATSKILSNKNFLSWNRSFLKEAGMDLDLSFNKITVTIKALEISTATAAPGTPNFGKPNHPRINPPDNMTCIEEVITIKVAGKRIFPIPLKTALKLPESQSRMPPKNKIEQ